MEAPELSASAVAGKPDCEFQNRSVLSANPANPANLPSAVEGGSGKTPRDIRDNRDNSPCAVSAISAGSFAMTPRFEQALEEFNEAQEALHTMPADATDARERATYAAFIRARDEFLTAPAGSLAELCEQASVLWRDDPSGCLPAAEVAALLARLRVLAGNPTARTFDQAYWLDRWERAGGQWILRGDEVTFLAPVDAERPAELMQELAIAGGRGLAMAEAIERHRGLAGEAEQ